ncbi:MAG: ribosomal protein [Gammaproteobacteria bacterium]|jgi:large subunit ribosomal protein L15|nr:ribosomal protein [Gammaproteobacteria bacterium]
MHLNTLKPAAGSHKVKIRVGRGWGSGVGKNGGKGNKGQKSRGSGKVAIGFEGGQMPLHRRLPKSGFNSWKKRATNEIRLSQLDKLSATEISMQDLKDLGVIGHNVKFAKIIATGVINRAVTLKGIAATAGAKALIEAAGGQVLG